MTAKYGMGHFKQWLLAQEMTVGSDGVRDNTPVATAQATNTVANKFAANPQNSDIMSKISTVGSNHPSALRQPLLDAGAKAVMKSGAIGKQTSAPAVAAQLGSSLGIKPTKFGFQPPKPAQVNMMRKRMRSQ